MLYSVRQVDGRYTLGSAMASNPTVGDIVGDRRTRQQLLDADPEAVGTISGPDDVARIEECAPIHIALRAGGTVAGPRDPDPVTCPAPPLLVPYATTRGDAPTAPGTLFMDSHGGLWVTCSDASPHAVAFGPTGMAREAINEDIARAWADQQPDADDTDAAEYAGRCDGFAAALALAVGEIKGVAGLPWVRDLCWREDPTEGDPGFPGAVEVPFAREGKE